MSDDAGSASCAQGDHIATSMQDITSHLQDLQQRFKDAARTSRERLQQEQWDADMDNEELREVMHSLRQQLGETTEHLAVMQEMSDVMHAEKLQTAFSQDERDALREEMLAVQRKESTLRQAIESKRSTYLKIIRPIRVTSHFRSAFYDAVHEAAPSLLPHDSLLLDVATQVQGALDMEEADLNQQLTMLDRYGSRGTDDDECTLVSQ